MIQAELQEEQQRIEDLEHQRVDYLNRAERIAERLTALKAEYKMHAVEMYLEDIMKNCDKIGHSAVINNIAACLKILQDK